MNGLICDAYTDYVDVFVWDVHTFTHSGDVASTHKELLSGFDDGTLITPIHYVPHLSPAMKKIKDQNNNFLSYGDLAQYVLDHYVHCPCKALNTEVCANYLVQ